MSIRIDDDGIPAGFLAHDDRREVTTFDVAGDGVAVLTLRRPNKLNAFDEQMMREIRSAIWRSNFDDSVRAIVIVGEGRAFCAGRDIPGLQYENGLPSPQFRAYVRANHEMLDDLEAIEKPVIAAVNGTCAGGGVEIAVSCDFRIAANTAEFLLPEINLGVIPASGACSRMIQMIGIGRVKEMVMTGRRIGADEALQIGLVNRVAASDAVLEDALAFARELCQRSPLALGMAKHVINLCQNVDAETGRLVERLGQSLLVQSADAREGIHAFREKRAPRFLGR